MSNGKILELVKKLIAHEQSARSIGSLAEADAFAEKIQELCAEHRLELDDLGAEEVRGGICEIEWLWRAEGWKACARRNERWLMLLANGVALGHECRSACVTQGSLNFGWTFIGRQTDANIAAAMFGVLVRAGLAAWAKTQDRRLKRGSFLWGFASAIAHRYEERRFSGLAGNSSTQALVRTIDLEIASFLESQGHNYVSKSIAPPKFNQSMALGWQAGKGTSLTSATLPSAARRLSESRPSA